MPVRREYNRWVANQTLEDYALRFTAKSARRWSTPRVAQTAIGAISFLALEAIGGSITLSYGVTNTIVATVVAFVVTRYGRQVANDPWMRRTLLFLFTVAFFSAAVAGMLGALINKVAPTR